ncbi:glycosyltransferase family protein [Horticoccus sp. 23ND18S-11]|uniref:glycosyltransferase family protein n=1 Tax=Horticoccus sp. 23ND18S-11 TaxID=3391832 RepID=UPI0039C95821
MSAEKPSTFRRIARALVHRALQVGLAIVVVGPLLIACLVARCITKRRIGLGPEPLINNVHHARALRLQGYDVTTFVSHVYFVTNEFDLRLLRWSPFNHYALFLFAIFRCRILYIYFNGGPLAWTGLWAIEPYLYKLAGTRVVAMPYGGDVQDFNVHDDVVYRAAYLKDYPDFVRNRMRSRRKQVQRWSRHADWIISGCDWVNYTPYWDTLMLAHFSVDTDQWSVPPPEEYTRPARFTAERPLRVLHGPNHRTIKGTTLLEKAIATLRAEGCPIELQIVQRVSNTEMRRLVRQVDVVVEQLVIGWYGIFALEAMASGKPVLTHIGPELERLYIHHGLLENDELPVTRVTHQNLVEALRAVAANRTDLEAQSRAARAFVLKHHSLAAIGRRFADINTTLGVPPVSRAGGEIAR